MNDHVESIRKSVVTVALIATGGLVLSAIAVCTTALMIVMYIYS